jgi:hypothetical protein
VVDPDRDDDTPPTVTVTALPLLVTVTFGPTKLKLDTLGVSVTPSSCAAIPTCAELETSVGLLATFAKSTNDAVAAKDALTDDDANEELRLELAKLLLPPPPPFRA